MTPELLIRVGEALYGPRWQTELAEALGVADRTMRRWASGAPMPPRIPDHLTELLLTQRVRAQALMDELKAVRKTEAVKAG